MLESWFSLNSTSKQGCLPQAQWGFSGYNFGVRNSDIVVACNQALSLVAVGVALGNPTTSYCWCLVTFCHNRICGLAVAFKN